MNKIEKYELMFIKCTWLFIGTGLVYFSLLNFAVYAKKSSFIDIMIALSAFSIAFLENYVKLQVVKKGNFTKDNVYMAFRIGEFALLLYILIFVDVGQWLFIYVAFVALITTLGKGTKLALSLLSAAFIVNIIGILIKMMFYPPMTFNYMDLPIPLAFFVVALYYALLMLFVFLCGLIYSHNLEGEQENKGLLEQLGEKYEQLAVAQEEIKYQYEKLKETNTKLEDTNKKLTGSIAEFYTLQQISQAISSILDIKELLKYVNDIILGVMGVSNSTIILYDHKKNKLKVHTTNIKNHDELITISDNINCSILLEVLSSGKPIIENFVDPSEYSFTHGREVNSLICVPFSTKSKKYGLVLIEHKYYNAFDYENVRLLDIIGQQVGIALENAELYQKMHELATIDGLTGVYNRLYFQERLQLEFKNAQEGDYELSLAIFDVDHFKRFNDTFGHLFGDKVIKKIAEIVRESLRNSDLIARFGGEEFIILFPRTSIKEAYEKVENLRQKIAKTQIKDNLVTASVTVSFGISSYPEFADSEGELLRSADAALYEAKSSGRNCVIIAKKSQRIEGIGDIDSSHVQLKMF